MTTDLEAELRAALRERAAAVPPVPMPRLGRAPKRRSRLLPVAAAVVAAAGIAGGVVALAPDDDRSGPPAFVPQPAPDTPRPGEVYYTRSVRGAIADEWFVQIEVWQSPERTGPWQEYAVSGSSVRNGRVLPDPTEEPQRRSGTCYPFDRARDAGCKQRPSWRSYPSLDFLAAAPRDPKVLGQQLHAAAVADAQSLVDDGSLPASEALGERNVAIRELSIIQAALMGSGVTRELRAALHQVVASLPGVRVTENLADRIGRQGTGYRFDEWDDETVLIFEGDTYLGSPAEAVVYGVAPGLGLPPSRLLD